MQTRTIGNDTVGRHEVGAIGLGLMTFDQTGSQPRQQLLDTVRAAVDAGARVVTVAVGTTADTPALRRAVAYANTHDALVVAWLAGTVLSETDAYLTWEGSRGRVIPGRVVRSP